MCADRLDQAVSPYDTMLQQRGVSVLTADLFTHRVIQAEQPDGLALADRLAVVPSPRAASALSRQSWFPAARSSLRVITPGAETARSVRELGVEPVWSAIGGFRREDLPAALRSVPKLYLGNEALEPDQRSFALDPAQGDAFLPIYRRTLSLRCPWTALTARLITQAPALSVLALSPSQRDGFESALSKLGPRKPTDLRLICLTDRQRTRFSANFWTEMAFPAQANRASMTELLKYLAF